MQKWIKGIWLPQETSLARECLKILTEDCNSILIQAIAGVDTELFCNILVGQLWEKGYYDNAFYIPWSVLNDPAPSFIIGQVLGLPVGQQICFPNELNRNVNLDGKPLIIIFSGVMPTLGQSCIEFLSVWSKYLHALKSVNEQGQGLRCLFCLSTEESGLGRHSIVPEPFIYTTWPEPDESTIENFVIEHIDDFCESLNYDAKQYTTYRIMDLAGNRRADIIELMQQVGKLPLRNNPQLVDELAWSHKSSFVKRAIDSIKRMDLKVLLPFLHTLFNKGGFISKADERHQSNVLILDYLWQQGLYTPPWGDKTFGALTPRALAALRYLTQEDERFNDIKGNIPLTWEDRAAREILDRCLQIERMLKHRAVQLIRSSPDLRKQLRLTLESPSRWQSQKTNREVTFESVRWQGLEEQVDDITLLESCTLGNFFFLFDSLGLQQHGNQLEHKKFVEIRNTMAHAQRANWRIYKGFLNIEERLIGDK